MKFISKLAIAAVALATPIFVAAQAPPAPGPGGQGPGMGMQQRMGPGMGQQMGPGMGLHGQPGMRMRQRMRQRFLRRHPGLAMHRMMQNPAMRERLKITPDQVAKFQAHESTMAKSTIRSRAEGCAWSTRSKAFNKSGPPLRSQSTPTKSTSPESGCARPAAPPGALIPE